MFGHSGQMFFNRKNIRPLRIHQTGPVENILLARSEFTAGRNVRKETFHSAFSNRNAVAGMGGKIAGRWPLVASEFGSFEQRLLSMSPHRRSPHRRPRTADSPVAEWRLESWLKVFFLEFQIHRPDGRVARLNPFCLLVRDFRCRETIGKFRLRHRRYILPDPNSICGLPKFCGTDGQNVCLKGLLNF